MEKTKTLKLETVLLDAKIPNTLDFYCISIKTSDRVSVAFLFSELLAKSPSRRYNFLIDGTHHIKFCKAELDDYEVRVYVNMNNTQMEIGWYAQLLVEKLRAKGYLLAHVDNWKSYVSDNAYGGSNFKYHGLTEVLDKRSKVINYLREQIINYRKHGAIH